MICLSNVPFSVAAAFGYQLFVGHVVYGPCTARYLPHVSDVLWPKAHTLRHRDTPTDTDTFRSVYILTLTFDFAYRNACVGPPREP